MENASKFQFSFRRDHESLLFLLGDLDNVIGGIDNERDDCYCLFISCNSDWIRVYAKSG